MKKIMTLGFLALAGMLSAQPALQVGGTFRGNLNPRQAQDYDGKKVVWHTVQANRGQAFVVRAESEGDGFLYAELPDGKVLSNDDTSGLNPAVIISGVAGRVRIGFAYLGEDVSGPYSLFLEPIPQGASARLGTSEGKINNRSPMVLGKRAQVFTFAATAGQSLVILAESEFDNKLLVVDAAGNQYADDDSGGNSNARLSVQNAPAGPLTIVVYPYSDGDEGNFTLTITAPPPPRPIQVGRAVNDTIDGTELALGGGDVYSESVGGDEYLLNVRSGQDYVVTMVSEDFDAYLSVNVGGESINDDDGGGGTNSRVQFTASQNGTVTITARPLNSGNTGRYTLTVSQPVLLQSFEGTLNEQSQRDISGKFYAIHNYRGTAGKTVSIRLSSSDYDTFLIIQDSSGAKLADNDDSGGGTDSMASVQIPANGTLRIISTTYSDEGESGSYVIRIYEE